MRFFTPLRYVQNDNEESQLFYQTTVFKIIEN